MRPSRALFQVTLFLISILLACGGPAEAQAPRRPAPATARAASPPAPQPGTLDERIKAEVASFRGKVWVFAKNLDTGATYSLRGNERVRTASTIKLPIMIATFAAVAEGKAGWDDELILTKEKKVSGSGILPEFHDGIRLTLQDAVHLMIVLSDNTATNLVLDRVGGDAVNARMDEYGFPNTRSLRKIGGGPPTKAGEDPVNRLYGIGMSTPQDVVTMLERLERGELVSAEASKEMLDILRREQYKEGIGRTLYDVPIASKSGALDRLRSDVALVYSRRGRIGMAITIDDMPEVHYSVDNPGLLMISKLSLLLLDGLATPVR